MQKLQFKNNMKILTNKAEEAIEDSVENKIAEKIITMKSMTTEWMQKIEEIYISSEKHSLI